MQFLLNVLHNGTWRPSRQRRSLRHLTFSTSFQLSQRLMSTQAELNRRISFHEQQLKDLEQHLQYECSSSVKAQLQYMQQMTEMGKRLQLKEVAVNHLNMELNQVLNAYRAQRQRADQLQLAVGSGSVQNQREVALREHIQRQEQQIREQQTSFSETTARLFEQRRNAQKSHERLQRTVELLEMRLQDQNVLLEEERVAEDHGTMNTLVATRDSAQQTDADEVQTTAMNLAQATNEERLNEQLREFEQERAQLLEQASDAATTQQNIILENLRSRDAALRCPISRDLLVDPVVTECCGRTFSSQSLAQLVGRSSSCPLCDEEVVRVHPSHDMVTLVHLHRSECSVLGMQDVVATNLPAPRTGDDDEITDANAGHDRRRTDQLSTRQRRPQERRTQRVSRRRSSRSGALLALSTEAFSTATPGEQYRQTRSLTLRLQRSSSDRLSSSGAR